MQEIDFYLVDAFSDRAFGGNSAAVCPLEEWLPDDMLLKMAQQHNQSETAFFVRTDGGFELRWFTTLHEINLCGHATLAASHVIFEYLDYPHTEIVFSTRFVGELTVRRSGDWLTLNFPAWETQVADNPPALLFRALGIEGAREVRVGRDYMVVLESQRQVEALTPDISAMVPLDKMVCVTAPGEEYDFVSRFFCPGEGVPEDPVTGSTHSMLIPYWSARLGKTQLNARQVSARGGDLRCELRGDRVLIGGQATLYLKGKIYLRNA
ncbi:PhzF family phenazine biosynthesis protein [Enterobacter sp. ECC-175]|uniref:PhzF family phenazine biosynthesis protein n=1 Tax=unclassified Enterobacter TaxID=2608935 RepID=UPI000D49500A|nr:PhzF family phenazine biosynthesis protein [Enterobacter sp. RIT 418]RAU37846.1 isomerase [Enterobacter sp. RIT 418]